MWKWTDGRIVHSLPGRPAGYPERQHDCCRSEDDITSMRPESELPQLENAGPSRPGARTPRVSSLRRQPVAVPRSVGLFEVSESVVQSARPPLPELEFIGDDAVTAPP
jgi:hypothetical protein